MIPALVSRRVFSGDLLQDNLRARATFYDIEVSLTRVSYSLASGTQHGKWLYALGSTYRLLRGMEYLLL